MGCKRLNTLLSVMLTIGGLVYGDRSGAASSLLLCCPRLPQVSLSTVPPNACRGERCGGLGAHSPQTRSLLTHRFF